MLVLPPRGGRPRPRGVSSLRFRPDVTDPIARLGLVLGIEDAVLLHTTFGWGITGSRFCSPWIPLPCCDGITDPAEARAKVLDRLGWTGT